MSIWEQMIILSRTSRLEAYDNNDTCISRQTDRQTKTDRQTDRHTHTHTHTHTDMERLCANTKMYTETCVRAHTHLRIKTHRERERERDRETVSGLVRALVVVFVHVLACPWFHIIKYTPV